MPLPVKGFFVICPKLWKYLELFELKKKKSFFNKSSKNPSGKSKFAIIFPPKNVC